MPCKSLASTTYYFIKSKYFGFRAASDYFYFCFCGDPRLLIILVSAGIRGFWLFLLLRLFWFQLGSTASDYFFSFACYNQQPSDAIISNPNILVSARIRGFWSFPLILREVGKLKIHLLFSHVSFEMVRYPIFPPKLSKKSHVVTNSLYLTLFFIPTQISLHLFYPWFSLKYSSYHFTYSLHSDFFGHMPSYLKISLRPKFPIHWRMVICLIHAKDCGKP